MALVAFTTRTNLTPGAAENISDVTNCLDKLLVGVNAIESANIVDATVTDTDLASPNNSLWRTIRSQPFFLGNVFGADTYLFNADGAACATAGSLSTAVGYTGSTGTRVPVPLPVVLASLTDIAVAGKTAQGRVVAHLVTNSVAPGTTLNFGLYAMSGLSGGANALTVTLGSLVGTSASLAPVAITPQTIASAAFTLVSGAPGYLLGVQFSSGLPAGCVCSGTIDLQVRFT